MNGQFKIFGVAYKCLYEEVNRIRREKGLESIGGLHFARKLHDHCLVEPNPRVSEAIRNVRKRDEERASEVRSEP